MLSVWWSKGGGLLKRVRRSACMQLQARCRPRRGSDSSALQPQDRICISAMPPTSHFVACDVPLSCAACRCCRPQRGMGDLHCSHATHMTFCAPTVCLLCMQVLQRQTKKAITALRDGKEEMMK